MDQKKAKAISDKINTLLDMNHIGWEEVWKCPGLFMLKMRPTWNMDGSGRGFILRDEGAVQVKYIKPADGKSDERTAWSVWHPMPGCISTSAKDPSVFLTEFTAWTVENIHRWHKKLKECAEREWPKKEVSDADS